MSAILHRVAARVRAWCRRSPVVAAPVLAPPRWQRSQRSNQPLLWTAKCSDTLKWWCGPVAVASTIGVDVAAVRDVIRQCRNGRAVKGTYANELQFAFQHFGYQMRLLTPRVLYRSRRGERLEPDMHTRPARVLQDCTLAAAFAAMRFNEEHTGKTEGAWDDEWPPLVSPFSFGHGLKDY